MGNAYVTIEEIAPYGWQVGEDDLIFFDALRVRASRMFEILAFVGEDYFMPGSGELEARTFYGTNSVYLYLPPFYEIASVTMPTNYTVPYYHNADGCLRTTDVDGILYDPMALHGTKWPAGVPVTITAKWGFKKIPEDVKQAVAEMIIAVWRTKDQAFLKAVDMDTNKVIVNAIPERTKMIANFYQNTRNFPAFV